MEAILLGEEECQVVVQAFLRKFILGNMAIIAIFAKIKNSDCSCAVIIFFNFSRRRPRKESEGEGSSPNRSRNSWTPSPGSKTSSPTINQKSQLIQTPSPLSDSSCSRRRSSVALSSPGK